MSEMQSKDRGNVGIEKGDQLPVTSDQKINPLKELYKLGQSPWYDNIERGLLKSGEFAKLINEYGVVGVTSNPTIFDKAISGSMEYDEQIKALVKSVKKGRFKTRPYEIYDELVLEDIGMAADTLFDVYTKTDGLDGYVSIEVLPQHAYDTKNTIDYARRIFRWLDRKNILIKVPGTREALPAITELISEGINVNVTLLFSVAHYEAIAKAYIDGLKRMAAAGEQLDDCLSVASVFVSRIDTKIDKMLENMAKEESAKLDSRAILGMRGKAAVANSKMIYQKFKEIFLSAEFSELRKKGAKFQRVLWASTGTKNPDYRDVKYVEELIGPHTINTMPHQTVLAFYDHGVVKSTIEENLGRAKKVLDELNSCGIIVDRICEGLQKEGVGAFSDSFNSLIRSIERKTALLK